MRDYSKAVAIINALNTGIDAWQSNDPNSRQNQAKIVNDLLDMAIRKQRMESEQQQMMRTEQEMRFAGQMQPGKLAQQGQELKTEEAQTSWTQNRAEVSAQEALEKKQIMEAKQAGYTRYQLEHPESKLSLSEWLYQEGEPSLGLASEKAKEALKTQQETTKYKTEQAKGEALKTQTGAEEQEAYEKGGFTKGGVIAGTEIAQMEKAKQDVVIAKARADYIKLQGEVAKARKNSIMSGKGISGLTPSQGLNQVKLDAINQLIDEGWETGEAYNEVMNKSQLTYANVSSMLNSLRSQASTEFDPTIKAELKEKIKLYESILEPALERMKVKEKPETTQKGIKGKIINGVWVISYNDWVRLNEESKLNAIKFALEKGLTQIRMNEPNGYYIVNIGNDDKGNPSILKINRFLSSTKPAVQAQPAKTQKSITPQAEQAIKSYDPRAIVAVKWMKQNGITDITQESQENIAKFKQLGIYDQVVELLKQR